MTAKEQIVDKKNQLTEKAKSVAHTAEEKATEVTHTAGEKLEAVAGVVRRGSESAAERFQKVGSYLQETDIRSIGGEITGFVKTHPIPSLIAGLVSGFLIGRVLAR